MQELQHPPGRVPRIPEVDGFRAYRDLDAISALARTAPTPCEVGGLLLQRIPLPVVPGCREPLVTDQWWLPLNLAADFYTRPIMLAEGNDELTHWASDMRTEGVTQFGFMTDKPDIFTGPWLSQVRGLRADGPPVQTNGIWLQKYTFGTGSSSSNRGQFAPPNKVEPMQH